MRRRKHGGHTSVSSATQDEHAVADADQGDREDRLPRARVARRAVTLLLPFPLNVEARHLLRFDLVDGAEGTVGASHAVAL